MTSRTRGPAVHLWLNILVWKRPAFAPLGLCLEQCSLQGVPSHISPRPYPRLSTVWPKCDVLREASLCYHLSRPGKRRLSPPSFSARCVALFYSHTLAVCFVLSAEFRLVLRAGGKPRPFSWLSSRPTPLCGWQERV